ncbi:MAG: hypothetical protein PF436_02095 [Prolixibacteraceae bacterium]|nr:hypothetical protein [Prolixibacteraceae bacterium]
MLSYPAYLNYSREQKEQRRWSDIKVTFADFWGVGVAITTVSLIIGLIVIAIQLFTRAIFCLSMP